MTGQIVAGIVALIVGGYCFTSAFFPEWDLRWGERSGRPFNQRAPVSRAGRFGFGILGTCFGGMLLIGDHSHIASGVLGAIFVITLIAMTFIARRDIRSYPRPELVATRSEKVWVAVLLFFVLAWILLILHFVHLYIVRGSYTANGLMIRQSDHPLGFWAGIAFVLAFFGCIAGAAVFLALKYLRAPTKNRYEDHDQPRR
jgi:hypothetical protein